MTMLQIVILEMLFGKTGAKQFSFIVLIYTYCIVQADNVVLMRIWLQLYVKQH